jgi:nicotinate-nucleotide adenylyltransferase
MVIGLYFGSFNPVHDGHVQVALSFQQQSGVDQVWWVLSPQNPFKRISDMASFEDRSAMVQLVLPQGHELCSIEQTLPIPSFTIQTLTALEQQFPENQWSILMGADSWNALPTWKQGVEIEARYPIWVYPRNGQETSAKTWREGPYHALSGSCIDVSSTAVRKAMQAGKEKPVGVSLAVWDYMVQNNLFSSLI